MFSFALAAGTFLTTDSFRERWHGFVTEELARHGVHLDFGSLTINPFGGLIAKKVRVFNDETRRHLVAAVDRLELDVDTGELMRGQVHITGLELAHTNVSLPVDLEHPDLTVVTLENLTAKAIIEGNHLNVRHATGLLAGIQVDISGVIELPEPATDKDPNRRSAMERLKLMQEHRARIQHGLDWLARFKSAQAPSLTVKVSGSLDRPQELQASLTLQAQNLAFEDYVWQEFVAEADYDGGFIDLKRLHLQDHLGVFDATATWRMGADQVRFRLNSSADLPGLARAFFSADQLREVVFYEAPQLALEGRLFVGGERAEDDFIPAEVTGRLVCGRFGSRGEIFDGLTLNLGASKEGLFVREASLRHKTGSLVLNLMKHREEGFRYDLHLRMDPNVFLPFVQLPKTREIIQRFSFDETSFIDVRMACAGATADIRECPSSGHGVVKNFRYKGVFFESVEMDLSLLGDIQNYANVRMQRPDGPGEAELVFVNDADDAKWLRLVNVRSEADAAGIVRAFAPKTADAIARYRFSAGTETVVNGTIGYRENPERNDFVVNFRNPVGGAHYVLWDEDRPIIAPYGKVGIKGSVLTFDVKGRLYGDTLDVTGSVDLSGPSRYDVRARAGRFPYEVFGERLFFENVDAKVTSKAGDTRFDIDGEVLEGDMTLKGRIDENRRPNAYEGEARISSVSFERFAEVYSPGDESIGDITGHFKFTGRMDDWRALKGGGALIIVNGNLLALPVLGPLTPVIGSILPSRIKGYNVAKKADCTFEVSNGFIVTDNIEAESSAFRIKSSGNVDFIRDDIDFNAEVRIRGITGIVLLPVTTLLAYKGSGTVGNTQWSPRIFGGGNKDERMPPTEMELREAQKIGGNPGRPPAAPQPPKRKPLFGK